MEASTLIIIGIVVFGLVLAGGVMFVFLSGPDGSRTAGLRGLMPASQTGDEPYLDDELATIEAIKRQSGSSGTKKGSEDIGRKLFRAGYYTSEDRRRFKLTQVISFAVATLATAILMHALFGSVMWVFIGIALGAMIGLVFPLSRLDRQIREREEDVMYYLPLVIEQVSIGVSSSLDVGPCIAQIVQMAEERDSHNPITEMFVHVEKLIRSGLNLEDSLAEVAEANGMTEVKHAFMFLAQCARHGGEVSKQLQELADAVMMQRQVQVEARITALPVKATGPLALVFAGFFLMLLSGLLIKLMEAFSAGI